MDMQLSQLLFGLPGLIKAPARDALISGLKIDSRDVQPGDLFVALSGETVDGHRFIADALARGAAAIVGQQTVENLLVPYVQVQDSRLALAYISAGFYGFPARRLVMIGVTGTDGKTTTANLIYHILQSAGLRTGMISTVNARIGEVVLDTGFHVTTPEAPLVQSYLAQMVGAGLSHVVLEATSHGLAQQRVAYCDFDLAVVTNVTHEHLDYHKSYEGYLAAKGLLLESLSRTSAKPFFTARGAVINRDDRSYAYLRQITQAPILSYGLTIEADITAASPETYPEGLKFTALGQDLDGKSFQLQVESALVGEFNLYNVLAAVTLACGFMKLDAEAVRRGIKMTDAIPGRMERIDLGQPFSAIVDFAHTPNALRKSLETARKLTNSRLIAVFGSAGLRDRQKRRLMAQVSTQLADLAVFTAEDPRTESLAGILADMAQGAEAAGGKEGEDFYRVPDRREAIRLATRLARPGDLVIACGKGHEQSMCFGEIEYLWDDRIALRAALSELLNIPGPEMPFLPDAAN
ncbi:MAG: UDP-N-acetylmuramoyl-L-alanyl-D-glutamate--2,6-diaminopimelate ligase [Anaerolineae bacterium UTCFX2]|jgi:UDP-N-acetylmuramoyl-L-alanyl-D-glutamate--2,6-diaminopimelate ligase|nr:UDP-N-acetylmuramoyl-L-alanyl-D-glutamate--2,6-diaminopimelate ligase [Anaerolineae bacterium]MCZ7552787.1 UDP-N-acetylmuramoyl-L-alanyl-D-glutamate--2,6-diaminopimelate ligase [Anaerolineales bacterium]OQY87228.1 MAG: UDP-N-acetylmuramoyl-L-alanyl-D-glutamate--2,6-diaminopimelate ligase [Anaerolineae bacterium UTCFX2]